MEKGPRTEYHLESLKVEAGEEEDEIMPAHRDTVRTQDDANVCGGWGEAGGWGPWALTCWWVRCPSSLYPRARTRAPSRDISVWMW